MIDNITLKIGSIFEINRNTFHTYFYDGCDITEITPQEFTIINSILPEERGRVLKDYRWKIGME